MRHCTVGVQGNILHVLYTNAGARPESILHSTIDLNGDWREWKESPARLVIEPEAEYEGADLELAPSKRGAIFGPARQLRDPYVFQERGRA
jgi:hypothetical protein